MGKIMYFLPAEGLNNFFHICLGESVISIGWLLLFWNFLFNSQSCSGTVVLQLPRNFVEFFSFQKQSSHDRLSWRRSPNYIMFCLFLKHNWFLLFLKTLNKLPIKNAHMNSQISQAKTGLNHIPDTRDPLNLASHKQNTITKYKISS